MVQAGLGGARDATNVITSSDLAVSIITNVGAEHLAALGGSLESIAAAKSGIIKEHCPVRWFLIHLSYILQVSTMYNRVYCRWMCFHACISTPCPLHICMYYSWVMT